MLEVRNLHARIGDKEILKGINLTINDGETHAIMGPNGSGKSTLSAVLVGNPLYEVTEGEAYFNGKNLLEMKPEDRAHEGLFLSFQYPVEHSGGFLHVRSKKEVYFRYFVLEKNEKRFNVWCFKIHSKWVERSAGSRSGKPDASRNGIQLNVDPGFIRVIVWTTTSYSSRSRSASSN